MEINNGGVHRTTAASGPGMRIKTIVVRGIIGPSEGEAKTWSLKLRHSKS